MGRASRKHWSETHPDRHLWTEAQRVHAEMQTQAEYEALYGRSSTPAPEAKLRSPFWNSQPLLDHLQTHSLEAEERINFLYHLDADFAKASGALELSRDRAFQKLFQDEWNALPLNIREKLSEEEMKQALAEGIIVFALTYKNADVYDDTARDQGPSSLLGAAVRTGKIDGSDLADALNQSWALSEVLPQLEYIRRGDVRNPENEFLQKFWQEVWSASGSPEILDVEARLEEIDKIAEDFYGGPKDRYFAEDKTTRRCRVYRNIFRHIGGDRNLGDMFRESVRDQGTLGPAANHGVQRALAEEIERTCLLQEDSDQDFHIMMKELLTKKPGSLEVLRPFFRKEGHLLDEAEECIRECVQRVDMPAYQVAETIQRAIWKGCEERNFQEDFHRVVLGELGPR